MIKDSQDGQRLRSINPKLQFVRNINRIFFSECKVIQVHSSMKKCKRNVISMTMLFRSSVNVDVFS